ncbi:hypothetical protein GCM10010873_31010 [Cypionkella aquatica]|uniref:Uncharacterized protein n=1 Tax=Cypionkella aquatica TaxID=1756042 RepID=A0AA37X1X1_9RHOB|nr:hypothetical protein [Cypionkella aquatica]GLS88127.1 hypothetical protein GCM10010873_31010 [Cypionkella aquatica]
MRQAIALLALLPMIACGPISREEAERACFERARLAQQPRGELGVGIGSDGRRHGFGEITISSDYIQGKDPDQVYQNCVYHRSGEMPSRPFTSIPAR